MKFEFKTQYTQKELSVMAKVLRKTLRKSINKKIHILGIFAIILGLLVIILEHSLSLRTIMYAISIIVLSMILIFEDKLNGFLAYKRIVKGMDNVTTVFTDESYTSIAELAQTEWKYTSIQCIAEDDNYFVFIIDNKHGQIYNKHSISNEEVEKFRIFIEDKTNKKIIKI